MMSAKSLTAIFAVVFVVASVTVAGAQPATAPPPTVDPFEAVIVKALSLRADARGEPAPSVVDHVARAVDGIPRVGPVAKQVASPSSASGSATIVDAPSFPELIGLALENNLAQVGANAVTLDLNLFGFRALAQPEVLDRQSLYGSSVNEWLRRLGGSFTLGGKGERFDRDGDGTPDDPLTAESFGDIVTWEIRFRLGSRDRRDNRHLRRYLTRVIDTESEIGRAVGAFIIRHRDDLSHLSKPVDPSDPDAGSAPDPGKLEAFLSQPATIAELEPISALLTRLISEQAEATRAIDRSPMLTIVVGGTQQEPQFGPDKWKFALRGVAATGPFDHTMNFDWQWAEGLLAAPNATVLKLGYGASALILRHSPLGADGAPLSISASAEHYRNVPAAKHDTVVKTSVKLDVPISQGVKLPVSVTYANHRDLLTDQSELVGHVGFAFDLSELRKKKGSD